MNIRFYCTVWGNTLPFGEICERVRKAGYDGVEMDLPSDPDDARERVHLLRDHDLRFIGQYWQSLETDFNRNRDSYRRHLEYLASTGPEFINAQTGKDYFSLDQNIELIRVSEAVARDTGIQVIHETHRGKFLFCLPKFMDAVQSVPELPITLDASHWCNVHESLLEDQSIAMELAIRATRHIHARVGHPEGPQVNDPRAAEWTDALNAHLGWWDAVVTQHRASGRDLTITPEFGPAPYMPEMPHTRAPLSSQWDVNVHMMNLLRERYGV
jgi:sugar phosphate isomerase/epimerase